MLVLLGAYVLVAVIQLVLLPSVFDAAKTFLADGNRSEFEDDIAGFGAVGLLTGALSIAVIVLTMIWLYRVVSNHVALGRAVTWKPGWAIGGWFVPPLVLYIVPMLLLRETWKASDPTVPPGDQRWKATREHPMLWVWWVLYGLVPIVFIVGGVTFGNFSNDMEDLAKRLDDQQLMNTAQIVAGVLAAGAWAFVVRGITARHTDLTGEQRKR